MAKKMKKPKPKRHTLPKARRPAVKPDAEMETRFMTACYNKWLVAIYSPEARFTPRNLVFRKHLKRAYIAGMVRGMKGER